MFGRDPEVKARKQEQRDQREAVKRAAHRAKELAKTPTGQAVLAREAGLKVFQVVETISSTAALVIPMGGAHAWSSNSNHGGLIQSVEAEGWRLIHADYVYRPTRSVSRDKFLSSGQEGAMEGEIVALYIFRACPV